MPAASDADGYSVNIYGVFDNREAAVECAKHNDIPTWAIVDMSHYEVQSAFAPETEEAE